MIELQVVSIAAPVSRLARGTTMTGSVHSVFTRSVNLLAGNALITLTDGSSGNQPNGICCRFEGMPLPMLFQQGDLFHLGHEALLFPDKNMVACLTQATVWEPDCPMLNRLTVETGARRLVRWLEDHSDFLTSYPHLRWLWDRLYSFSPLPIQGDPWIFHFADSIENMIHAVENAAWADALASAKNLLGLGIGLTPSGDDFLLGFFTAGQTLGPWDVMDHLVSQIADSAPQRSPLVSATFLHALSQRQISERFGSLLAALNCPDPELLDTAAISMLHYGSSSGMDTMFGLLFGIQTFIGSNFHQQSKEILWKLAQS